ncbi:MAG: aminoacyl-histidine dipeptidase [Rikenellaceae bacterium]
MNRDLTTLEPQLVWRHFEKICSIPHPSTEEEALSKAIIEYAKSLSLECEIDHAGNVIIRKGATAGMESRQCTLLQAHLDMVPQKNNDKEFDFSKDPIECYIDGEWVRANGTTLGADNGIGMAAALALLEDPTAVHGDIEILLTVNEERGMDGAEALKPDQLRSTIMLNLDTEDEDELCIGCAGGLNLVAKMAHQITNTPRNGYVARRLEIKGLKGGHSGVQIHEQRANANKLLFRLLRLTKLDIILVSADGGTLSNAIPREASVDLLIHKKDLKLFEEQVSRFKENITLEYTPVEESISLTLNEIAYPKKMIDQDSAALLVWAMAAAPDGVHNMSNTIPGLVQTSSNLAIVRTDDDSTMVEFFIRSASETQKVELADTIASIFELADGDVSCTGSHPGWLPNPNSAILKVVKECFTKQYGEEPKVQAVHAGLECGLIGSIYPKMDMISMGPTIVSPHSPDECVEIGSVARFYTLLKSVLANIPE